MSVKATVPPDNEPLAAEREINEQTSAASVWQEGGWYLAQALEVNIASQGNTVESALANLGEALGIHFEPPTSTVSPQVHAIQVKVGSAWATPNSGSRASVASGKI